jgi:hemerythrin-like domain-containing protein
MEHDLGRNYVRAMEIAVQGAQAGDTGTYQAIADNALGYGALLRDHISKENEILYPLAERVIPEAMRDSILQGYEAAETLSSPDLDERYSKVVQQYEQE